MTAAPAIVTPREHPMLFSAPMIRALLDGTKTMTRRIVQRDKVKGVLVGCDACWNAAVPHNGREAVFGGGCYLRVPACEHVGPDGYPGGGRFGPKWREGDRLWVKETHLRGETPGGTVWYRATEPERIHSTVRWTPSIFMPRWASRITLEVTGVRVERLHAITEEDARAEGVERILGTGGAVYPGTGAYRRPGSYRKAFAVLWDQINGKRAPMASNPFVWAISFRVTPDVGRDR